MAIETKNFGGNGGNQFEIEAVKSLGLRSGGRIDALLLNGTRHGGNGGVEGTTLEFHPDEYIDRIVIRHGSRIDRIEIHTNKERTLNGGGTGGVREELTNIRVFGLGGNSGGELDKLRVRLIKNYTEPTLVQENQRAIIDIVPPGETIERSVSHEVRKLSAYTRMMETVFTAEIGGESSAIGDYIAKLTAKTSLTRTSRSEIKDEVTTIEQSFEKSTYTPPAGSVGLEFVHVDVLREEDGFAWLFPVSEPELLSIALADGLLASHGAYDLTKLLAAQMPSMANRFEQRNGFDYYRATND